ncbi:MAG: hypothetical protein DRP66_02720 [Planctomycetota bacterium]|nr:MAG: hypothetical protein DRP66_02720 [Planctomycetota bacterium]
MKMVITILRWMAVLPGAILFVFISDFPIHWIVVLQEYIPDKIITFDNPAQLEYLLYAFFNPFILIMSATFIAPSKKFWVGLLFIVLSLILALVGLVYSKQNNLATYSAPEITLLLNIAGYTVGCIYIYNKYWSSKMQATS